MRLPSWLRGVVLGAGPPLEELGVIELTANPDLDGVLSRSGEVPVLIFKHSTTCPISASAHRRVAEYLNLEGDEAVPVYLVKVIESRPLSNEITKHLGVKHESPQVILVKDGKPVWSASHGDVTVEGIRGAVEAVEE